MPLLAVKQREVHSRIELVDVGGTAFEAQFGEAGVRYRVQHPGDKALDRDVALLQRKGDLEASQPDGVLALRQRVFALDEVDRGSSARCRTSHADPQSPGRPSETTRAAAPSAGSSPAARARSRRASSRRPRVRSACTAQVLRLTRQLRRNYAQSEREQQQTDANQPESSEPLEQLARPAPAGSSPSSGGRSWRSPLRARLEPEGRTGRLRLNLV